MNHKRFKIRPHSIMCFPDSSWLVNTLWLTCNTWYSWQMWHSSPSSPFFSTARSCWSFLLQDYVLFSRGFSLLTSDLLARDHRRNKWRTSMFERRGWCSHTQYLTWKLFTRMEFPSFFRRNHFLFYFIFIGPFFMLLFNSMKLWNFHEVLSHFAVITSKQVSRLVDSSTFELIIIKPFPFRQFSFD